MCLGKAMYECVKSSTLSLEQRTECCRKFISDMIRGYGCVLGPPSEDCPRKNQLHPRAEHDFLDFKRTLDRIQKHEIPISERDGDLDEGNSLEPVDPAPTPEECPMQKALWEAIVEATKELTPRQQLLFHLKYGRGQIGYRNRRDHESQRKRRKSRDSTDGGATTQDISAKRRKRGASGVSQGAPPPPQALTSVSIHVKSQ